MPTEGESDRQTLECVCIVQTATSKAWIPSAESLSTWWYPSGGVGIFFLLPYRTILIRRNHFFYFKNTQAKTKCTMTANLKRVFEDFSTHMGKVNIVLRQQFVHKSIKLARVGAIVLKDFISLTSRGQERPTWQKNVPV